MTEFAVTPVPEPGSGTTVGSRRSTSRSICCGASRATSEVPSSTSCASWSVSRRSPPSSSRRSTASRRSSMPTRNWPSCTRWSPPASPASSDRGGSSPSTPGYVAAPAPLDLVHHGGGTAPVGGHRPIVLTIHDLQYLTHPEYLSASKLRYLSWSIPRSVSRATVVAVPTDYVRRTGHRRVRRRTGPGRGRAPRRRTRAGRRRTVGGRVAPSTTGSAPAGCSSSRRSPIRTRGIVFLLEVMARYWDDPDLRLVLLGGAGAADDEVTAMIERLELGRRVVRPGRVTDADRDGLIALADALVFPSEYEGFGAPVVEAMALGTPVICSDQPALAEVVGDAGIVLPREAEAWADALDVLARRAIELRAAGRRRAASFTAERSGAASGRGLSNSPRRRPMSQHAAADDRAVPALRAGHCADGHGDDPDRRRTRRARPHGPRGHVVALVPPPPDRARLERSLGAPGSHLVGVDHPRAPVPRRRQVESAAPGDRFRRLSALAGVRASASVAGDAGRRRDRHVAAAHAGPHRVARAVGSGAARWSSTSRTCSPMRRWRPGRSRIAGSSRWRRGSNG